GSGRRTTDTGFRLVDLQRDESPGGPARRGQSRPGLPRFRRAGLRQGRRPRRDRRRPQPVRDQPRHAAPPPCDRRDLGARPGPGTRPRRRDHRCLRRDRDPGRRDARLPRSRRRGDRLRAVLRCLSADDRFRRGDRPPGHPPRAGLVVRPGRTRRRVRAAHPPPAAQHAAQPDRQGFQSRRTRANRGALHRARRDRRHRRGLRPDRLPRHRRGPPAAHHSAGDVGADADGQQHRQDVQHDRLEDRLRGRPGQPERGAAHSSPVRHLRHRDPIPGGDGGRTRTGGGERLLRPVARRVHRAARSPHGRAARRRARHPADRRRLFPPRRHRAARLPGRRGLLPPPRRRDRRRGDPALRLLRRPHPRAATRPLLLRQATGDDRRRRRAPGRAAPL
ncbi:MAG: Aspartate aminotransferase, partial [uncultured Thermomicrobiales bacterium]